MLQFQLLKSVEVTGNNTVEDYLSEAVSATSTVGLNGINGAGDASNYTINGKAITTLGGSVTIDGAYDAAGAGADTFTNHVTLNFSQPLPAGDNHFKSNIWYWYC